MTERRRARPGSSIAVWDLPIRLFHWALVVLIAAAWWTAGADRLHWHKLCGYAIAALLAFRAVWGVWGGPTARFASFVVGPGQALRYLRTKFFTRDPHDQIGHTPLGAFSVLALLIVCVGIVASGLFAVDTDGLESGPLPDRVSYEAGRWLAVRHGQAFDALRILIALHIATILFYWAFKRNNLIRPMISGRRPAPAQAGGPPPRGFSPRLAIAYVALSAASIWALLALRLG